MDGILFEAFVFLCAAVIAVPIAKRLGLGSVLGYLLAGIAIGPVIGLVGSQHFAEFGVVMMLFLVGLELEPRMLWQMRNRLLGLGGLQVAITTGLIAAGGLLFGLTWTVALVVGLIFSLSSTAIVLQTLSEKGLIKTDGGRASFSVLLFQDIAVIPMLALIPLLALPELAGGGADAIAEHAGHAAEGAHHEPLSLVAGLPAWALCAGGAGRRGRGAARRALPDAAAVSLHRRVALREIFTAAALLLVVGIALLMTLVELSPALGTFLAGVVLADSEFRHELESDIEPFKGLLLGLFFITVGAGIDFGVLAGDAVFIDRPDARGHGHQGRRAVRAGTAVHARRRRPLAVHAGLAQAGEFGFVLLAFSCRTPSRRSWPPPCRWWWPCRCC
jgi:CPA2 family monovalent cation:H+ antiporter-2